MKNFLIPAIALLFASKAYSEISVSGKLLLTGGVTNIEGSAGGGITPWAFIGGNGTKDQIGANAFITNVDSNDYRLQSFGGMIGILDRAELSFVRQEFNTQAVGALLGVGHSFKLKQNIMGLKIRVYGDGVLDQNTWIPQIAIGAEHKKNLQETIVKSLGATKGSGTDYYIAATKICLKESVLTNLTLRMTKANQIGLLGFGGDRNDSYKPEIEASAAYLVNKTLAIGAEFRSKPDNLKVAKEQNWSDLFLAWAPNKNFSATVAYAMLGNIALKDRQNGAYTSFQIGF